jgi:hypothetical protein
MTVLAIGQDVKRLPWLLSAFAGRWLGEVPVEMIRQVMLVKLG